MNKFIIFIVLCVFFSSSITFSQDYRLNKDFSYPLKFNSSYKGTRQLASASSVRPFAVITGIFLYLLNPIILYDNNKIALGITKEFSVGFGDFGENRASVEYSKIFREFNSHHLRIGYKRDILTADRFYPSNNLQGTGLYTLGLSGFTDFENFGVSPEISYGYSLRNHKLLIFPYLKLRYTSLFMGLKNDIIDFSFGLIIGIGNPFSDKKIRREYN